MRLAKVGCARAGCQTLNVEHSAEGPHIQPLCAAERAPGSDCGPAHRVHLYGPEPHRGRAHSPGRRHGVSRSRHDDRRCVAPAHGARALRARSLAGRRTLESHRQHHHRRHCRSGPRRALRSHAGAGAAGHSAAVPARLHDRVPVGQSYRRSSGRADCDVPVHDAAPGAGARRGSDHRHGGHCVHRRRGVCGSPVGRASRLAAHLPCSD